MKKILKIFLTICISLGLFACSENTKEIKTINLVATENSAMIAEMNTVYRMDTEFKNDDGSYILFNFQSVYYFDEYIVNNGDKIKNIIVIENGLPIEETVNLVKEIAYFNALDQYGNEIELGDIFTQSGSEFAEIIFSAKDVDETKNIKFIVMGGLDTQTNSESKIVFKVD